MRRISKDGKDATARPFVLWTFPPLARETLDLHSLQNVSRFDPRNIKPSFVKQEADNLLRLLILPFAEVAEAEVAFGIEDVFGGPVAVGEVAPGGIVVVLDHEPADVVLFDGGAKSFDPLLEIEFGSVHS